MGDGDDGGTREMEEKDTVRKKRRRRKIAKHKGTR